MRIDHDIHTHTLFSSCCYDPAATMKAFVSKARELGHRVIGISNHLWDEKVEGASDWYRGQCIEYGFEAKYAIPEDTGGVRVLFGVETEYRGMSDILGMTAQTASRFDYVLIPHTHTHMKNFVIEESPDVKKYRSDLTGELRRKVPGLSEEMAARMAGSLKYSEVRALIGSGATVDEEKYLCDFCFSSFESLMKNTEFTGIVRTVPTLIAHPFYPCGLTKEERSRVFGYILEQKDRLYSDFSECAGLGVGLDVNLCAYSCPENGYSDDPMVQIMRIALEAGCRFAFGTDSHSVSGLEKIRRADAVSCAIGIGEDDLIPLVR